jgi:hypothetical protein
MIYYFSKCTWLSAEQTTKLKEYVVLEDEKIFEVLSAFESSKDEISLLEDLRRLYSNEELFLRRAGPLSENTSINAISGVGYKKQLSVNTDRSFLNNAMSSISKRHEDGVNIDKQVAEEEVTNLII